MRIAATFYQRISIEVAATGKSFQASPFVKVDCTPPGRSCQDHTLSGWDVRANRPLENTNLAYTNENSGNLS